jgi:hypothetical protein
VASSRTDEWPVRPMELGLKIIRYERRIFEL